MPCYLVQSRAHHFGKLAKVLVILSSLVANLTNSRRVYAFLAGTTWYSSYSLAIQVES